jgi:hypothetical protein
MQNDVTPHALARETHQWPQEVSFDFFNTIDPEETFSLLSICNRDRFGSGIVLDFGLMVLTAGGPG